MTDSMLRDLEERPDFVYIVFIHDRPGVASLHIEFEHRFFPPQTPEYDLLDLGISQQYGVTFLTAGFPATYLSAYSDLAGHHGLKVIAARPNMLVHKEGEAKGLAFSVFSLRDAHTELPGAVGELYRAAQNDLDWVRYKGPCTHTLENTPGHAVYQNPHILRAN